MESKNISALVPAFNEEKNIKDTILALKKIEAITEIIVIDDGSKDRTKEIAQGLDIKVISQPTNLGKGDAINTGSRYVNGKYVALVDADLGKSAEDINLLITPIINNKADISVAIFPPAKRKGGFGLVKKLATFGLKVRTKQVFKAPLSGQRVMSKDTLLDLVPFSPRFGLEVEMTIKSAKKGYKIIEVETNLSHAETGRDLSGIIHRGKQFKDVFISILIKGWKK
ncbi:Glycosyl transferase family 2 [Desulfonispora thiosulfatigenes DSM 11270]|uniref:Glycosyl transferase family 2 n=1 Tax=Desulfonispora thiosulfatigenes DSM 11270 TaxID=656914 RepID=A0A1W1VNT5_DESTI|nr:glycosyltransferase family 2 protein [Desulfonispora thiosulfatigenes]SMB95029.1 Glycosyl transferase family 2 [Desulfonispora thiosulfatigenes DSM 11270]